MPKKIIIDGVIGWDIWPRLIRNQLKDVGEKESLEVEISSPGGFVYDGLEIFNMLKNHKGEVTVSLTGLAASMASYIALAGDKIKIEKNAVFMIHNARVFTGGDQNQLRKTADIIEGISNLLADEYVSRSGKPLNEIKSLMDDETFFFGKEIIEEGFADEIIDSEKTVDKQQALAVAKTSIDNCIKSMKESDRIDSDYDKAAAFLKDKKISCKVDNSTPIINQVELPKKEKIENKSNGGKKIMTELELKAQYPEIYEAVFKAGKESGTKAELERCSCFIEAMNELPEAKEIYLNAIKTGKNQNDASIQAAVMSMIMAQKNIKENEENNVQDIKTENKPMDKADKTENENITGEKEIQEAQNTIRRYNGLAEKEVK